MSLAATVMATVTNAGPPRRRYVGGIDDWPRIASETKLAEQLFSETDIRIAYPPIPDVAVLRFASVPSTGVDSKTDRGAGPVPDPDPLIPAGGRHDPGLGCPVVGRDGAAHDSGQDGSDTRHAAAQVFVDCSGVMAAVESHVSETTTDAIQIVKPALLIDGGPKTGKSFVAQHVYPAVLGRQLRRTPPKYTPLIVQIDLTDMSDGNMLEFARLIAAAAARAGIELRQSEEENVAHVHGAARYGAMDVRSTMDAIGRYASEHTLRIWVIIDRVEKLFRGPDLEQVQVDALMLKTVLQPTRSCPNDRCREDLRIVLVSNGPFVMSRAIEMMPSSSYRFANFLRRATLRSSERSVWSNEIMQFMIRDVCRSSSVMSALLLPDGAAAKRAEERFAGPAELCAWVRVVLDRKETKKKKEKKEKKMAVGDKDTKHNDTDSGYIVSASIDEASRQFQSESLNAFHDDLRDIVDFKSEVVGHYIQSIAPAEARRRRLVLRDLMQGCLTTDPAMAGLGPMREVLIDMCGRVRHPERQTRKSGHECTCVSPRTDADAAESEPECEAEPEPGPASASGHGIEKRGIVDTGGTDYAGHDAHVDCGGEGCPGYRPWGFSDCRDAMYMRALIDLDGELVPRFVPSP